jgi:hypothetical protein
MARERERDDEPRGRKRDGGEDMNFTAVDYDVSEMPVDAPEGAYTGKIKKVDITKSKKDGYPQIVLEVRLIESEDEEGEEAVKQGCSLNTYITFFPKKEGRRGTPSKLALKGIMDSLHLDSDLVPTRIETKRDLEDLSDALKGQELSVWVVHREDDSGEVRCDLRFKAPKKMAGSGRRRDDEDEDRPRKNGHSNGNGSRTRGRDEDEDEKPRSSGRSSRRDDDEDEPRVNARGGSDRRPRDADADEDEPAPRNARASRRDRDEDDDRPRARSRD